MAVLARAGRAARALALLIHQGLEALVVDGEALFGEQLLGQVVREAVGVVQAKGVLGVDPRGRVPLRIGDQLRQQLGPAVERAAEALLLVGNPAHDRIPLGLQVRVGTAEQLDRPLGEPAEVGRLEPQDPALLDRAAHDPPQHVTAVLVGGHHAVRDQVDGTPGVVGDDPHRPGHLRVGAVFASRELLGQRDQRRERVRVEDRVDALLDHRHALEPEARVDVALRQVGQRAVVVQLVGHEDVVPVLEIAVRVVAGPQVVGTELRAAVDVHLRARTAGPGWPRLPEVLRRREAHDPLLGHADLAPDLDRFGVRPEAELLVALEHGDPDPLGVEPKAPVRELPAEAQRLGLEVVADREVAEHLEEGQVALGRAHDLDVDGAKRPLRGRQAAARRLLATLEIGLELLHARDGEQG